MRALAAGRPRVSQVSHACQPLSTGTLSQMVKMNNPEDCRGRVPANSSSPQVTQMKSPNQGPLLKRKLPLSSSNLKQLQ